MLENPFAVLHRLPPTVRILVWGTLVNKLGSFILPYLTLVLSREFHMTGAQAGGLVMAYGLGSLVSIITGGVLTDRLGRRHTLMLSLFGSGVLALAMALAPTAHVLVPILLLFGFLADLYRPASSAIIGDQLPSSQRAAGFAALRTAVNLGFAFGIGAGGFLVDVSWRLLFAADGLTTLLFGVVVFLGIPETQPPVAIDCSAAAPQESPWRDRAYMRLLLASFAFTLVFFSFLTVLPLTMTLSAGYPASTFGMLVAVNGLLIAALEMSAVVWLSRYRRLRVAALGSVIVGIAFGLIGFVMHWAWFLLMLLLWTVGEIMAIPQQMSFVADWAPPRARGRYLGLYGATWSLGLMVNPIVMLPLHARLPEPLFWPLLLVVAAPTSLLLLNLDSSADRPELLRGHLDHPAPQPLPVVSPDL